MHLLQEPAVAGLRVFDAMLERRRQALGPVGLSRLGVPLVDCAIERSCRTLEALVRLTERGIGGSAALGVPQGRNGGSVLGEEKRQPCDDEERRTIPAATMTARSMTSAGPE